MSKEECHEYRFELTFSQYDSEKEISDAALERVLDAMIDVATVENLRMGGGYSEYCWIHAAETWVSTVLAGWRNRILRLLGKSRWRKGVVVIVEYGEWAKLGAPRDGAL